jgi:hypothetical protein
MLGCSCSPSAQRARCGDMARIADALALKLIAPAPRERKMRAPDHSRQDLLTQRANNVEARTRRLPGPLAFGWKLPAAGQSRVG